MDDIDKFHPYPMFHLQIPKRSSCCRWFLLFRVVSLQHTENLAAGRSPEKISGNWLLQEGKLLRFRKRDVEIYIVW